MERNTIQLWGMAVFWLIATLGSIAQTATVLTNNTEQAIECFAQNPVDFAQSRFDNSYYLNIRFNAMPSKQQIKALKQEGVNLLSYKGDYQYTASIPLSKHRLNWASMGVAAVAERLPFVSTVLQQKIKEKQVSSSLEVVVLFYTQIETKKIEHLLQSLRLTIVQKMDKGHSFQVRLSLEQLEKLMSLAIVQQIDLPAPEVQALNHENRVLHRVNILQSNAIGGYNLDGSNVVVGVGDGGQLGKHIDLNCRTTNKAEGTYNAYGAHGDHVAGTLAGSGNLNPRCKGMATNSELIIHQTVNTFLDAP